MRRSRTYEGARSFRVLYVMSRILINNTIVNRKPVEIKQNRCNVFVFSREGDETSSGILDVL